MLKDLKRLDTHPVPPHREEIRLFCVVQNEALRLPAFLNYYRQLGVDRFFIVDNNSSDETNALLRAQPDVHLFHTAASFAAANFGLRWQHDLLAAYGIGHWCVIADADELLIYPGSEMIGLQRFCASLDAEGSAGMQTLLLDMYSDQPMAAIRYQPGDDLLAACPYFDRDYHFAQRLRLPGQPLPFPATEPLGGPRARLFYPQQHRHGAWLRLMVKAVFRTLKPLADRGWLHLHQLPHPAPQLFKIPLIKWQAGCCLITSHRIRPVRLSTTTGALLHFKFLHDFATRTAAAIAHGQHYGGSIEYQRYAALLKRNPDVTFMVEGSVRYRSSDDVLRAGLMQQGALEERDAAFFEPAALPMRSAKAG